MEINHEFIQCFADEASDSLQRWEVICFELSKGPQPALYQELFRIAHNLKGGSHSVGLSQYGDFIHKVEDGITLLRDAKLQLESKQLELLLRAHQLLSEWTRELKSDPQWVPRDPGRFLAEYRACFFGGETAPLEPSPMGSPAAQAPVVAKPGESVAAAKRHQAGETIRISAEKLDALIQVIGELSIHQSIVWHTKGSENQRLFLNSLQLGQKLTKELYDQALSLRMQPLQQVFQRLERSVLDLSTSLQKPVNVEVSGGDVELDKAVIEKILDPLTHIVRNAVDHGLEAPEERTGASKSPTGRLKIAAHKDAFGVEISIQDDGRGLNAARIRAKAVERGLIAADAEPSPQEIYNLILLPGFSTAEKITDISGRGVGLDVVHKTLQELGGQMVIQSHQGEGTSFSITLPTSVSIIEVLLVEVGEQNYAVPVSAIDEVIASDVPLAADESRRLHGGHTLSLRDLESLLEKRRRPKLTNPRWNILICRHKDFKVGLLAGRILGQHPVVIRTLNPNIEGSFGVLGGTILGNGEPGLILDLPRLLKTLVDDPESQEKCA
jgi:two-component system chemotaxis sensor kinase CheA